MLAIEWRDFEPVALLGLTNGGRVGRKDRLTNPLGSRILRSNLRPRVKRVIVSSELGLRRADLEKAPSPQSSFVHRRGLGFNRDETGQVRSKLLSRRYPAVPKPTMRCRLRKYFRQG